MALDTDAVAQSTTNGVRIYLHIQLNILLCYSIIKMCTVTKRCLYDHHHIRMHGVHTYMYGHIAHIGTLYDRFQFLFTSV